MLFRSVLSSTAAPKRVGTDVERLVANRFGLDIQVVVRTRAQLAAVVKRNPLGEVAKNPKLYQVTFLQAAPAAEVVRKLEAAAAGKEQVVHIGRELYAWPHGKANMVRFNFFAERGAFSRDADGRYRVDFEKMRSAMNALSAKLLTVQGDGDYAEAQRLTETMGVMKPELTADLARLKEAKIPIDIRFDQGLDVLGLSQYATPKTP